VTATTLDGKAILATIKEELRQRVAALAERGVVPGLGTVLVGDDPGSRWYVGAKHKDCAEIGIHSIRRDLPAASTLEEVLAVEAALRRLGHLEVTRLGHTVVARTGLGRDERVVLAGHLDTVPLTTDPRNLPTRRVDRPGGEVLWGRGTVDMKGGVAVVLRVAHELSAPNRDLTLVLYEAEEVDSRYNGLGLIEQERPQLVADADFAVLLEPTDARIEGGCKGTLRAVVTTRGTAAHSARPWKGHNAIHDAAEVLARLAAYEPATREVDGLDFREALNAVGISGGVAGNVIPDRCEVVVNYRYAPSVSEAEAEAHVRSVFAGFDVEVVDTLMVDAAASRRVAEAAIRLGDRLR